MHVIFNITGRTDNYIFIYVTIRNVFITDRFTNGKLKKSIGSNFINRLTDVKNLSVKDTLVIKKINITDKKLICW